MILSHMSTDCRRRVENGHPVLAPVRVELSLATCWAKSWQHADDRESSVEALLLLLRDKFLAMWCRIVSHVSTNGLTRVGNSSVRCQEAFCHALHAVIYVLDTSQKAPCASCVRGTKDLPLDRSAASAAKNPCIRPHFLFCEKGFSQWREAHLCVMRTSSKCIQQSWARGASDFVSSRKVEPFASTNVTCEQILIHV